MLFAVLVGQGPLPCVEVSNPTAPPHSSGMMERLRPRPLRAVARPFRRGRLDAQGQRFRASPPLVAFLLPDSSAPRFLKIQGSFLDVSENIFDQRPPAPTQKNFLCKITGAAGQRGRPLRHNGFQPFFCPKTLFYSGAAPGQKRGSTGRGPFSLNFATNFLHIKAGQRGRKKARLRPLRSCRAFFFRAAPSAQGAAVPGAERGPESVIVTKSHEKSQ